MRSNQYPGDILEPHKVERVVLSGFFKLTQDHNSNDEKRYFLHDKYINQPPDCSAKHYIQYSLKTSTLHVFGSQGKQHKTKLGHTKWKKNLKFK